MEMPLLDALNLTPLQDIGIDRAMALPRTRVARGSRPGGALWGGTLSPL